jgi:hypothetical protein
MSPWYYLQIHIVMPTSLGGILFAKNWVQTQPISILGRCTLQWLTFVTKRLTKSSQNEKNYIDSHSKFVTRTQYVI